LLAGYGLTVNFTKQDVVCVPTDNHCVIVNVQNPPLDPTACGATVPDPNPDGTWAYRANIYIPPAYSGWDDPQYITNVMNHEFGHLFGLENQPFSCSRPDSVMNTPNGPCGTLGSLPLAPTTTDHLPVGKTVYGPGPRTTCQ